MDCRIFLFAMPHQFYDPRLQIRFAYPLPDTARTYGLWVCVNGQAEALQFMMQNNITSTQNKIDLADCGFIVSKKEKGSIKMYTVYKNPSDYPGKYVVRIFHGEIPEEKPLCVEDTLEAARSHIPPGLVHLHRTHEDDPVILETWI